MDQAVKRKSQKRADWFWVDEENTFNLRGKQGKQTQSPKRAADYPAQRFANGGDAAVCVTSGCAEQTKTDIEGVPGTAGILAFMRRYLNTL